MCIAENLFEEMMKERDDDNPESNILSSDEESAENKVNYGLAFDNIQQEFNEFDSNDGYNRAS